jgi:NitT/TauT family transport system substrate-binding protein
MKKTILIILLIALTLGGCNGDAGIKFEKNKRTKVPYTKIRMPMGYIPSVQFAPFYVAVEKGYFKEEGLEVSFDYSFETDAVTLVGHQNIPFAVVSAEQVLLARTQGLPVVYVMNYYKDYPISIVSKKKSGITDVQSLRGKKIGIPILAGASYIGLRALLSSAAMDEREVSLEVIGYNQVESLKFDRQDAVVCYTNNEPIQLRALGEEINEIKVADHVTLVSNGIITNEEVIRSNPELVRRMVRATLRGMKTALEDPKETYEICKKYVENLNKLNPEQEKVQKEILKTTMDLWKAKNLGESDPEAWKNMQKVLLDMGMLTKKINLDKAYSNDYIK